MSEAVSVSILLALIQLLIYVHKSLQANPS